MVGELGAADENTQTESLLIPQPSALAPGGFNNVAHTTLSPQSGLISTWGMNGIGCGTRTHLYPTRLEPSTRLELAISRLRSERTTSCASTAGASDRTRTCDLLYVKQVS